MFPSHAWCRLFLLLLRHYTCLLPSEGVRWFWREHVCTHVLSCTIYSIPLRQVNSPEIASLPVAPSALAISLTHARERERERERAVCPAALAAASLATRLRRIRERRCGVTLIKSPAAAVQPTVESRLLLVPDKAPLMQVPTISTACPTSLSSAVGYLFRCAGAIGVLVSCPETLVQVAPTSPRLLLCSVQPTFVFAL
ncbi:hypothetical protein BJ546DRAFT_380115 [Cryomyces antarcticus]